GRPFTVPAPSTAARHAHRLLRSRSVCPTHGAVTDGRYSSNAHDTRPPRRATSTPPPGAAALGLVLLCEALDDLGDPHFELLDPRDVRDLPAAGLPHVEHVGDLVPLRVDLGQIDGEPRALDHVGEAIQQPPAIPGGH